MEAPKTNGIADEAADVYTNEFLPDARKALAFTFLGVVALGRIADAMERQTEILRGIELNGRSM